MTPFNNTPHLQPRQDIKPHTILILTNTKSTNINKTHSARDAIMLPVATFEWTKQIKMGIDKLLHLITLCNFSIHSLSLKGLCKYNNLHKAYF